MRKRDHKGIDELTVLNSLYRINKALNLLYLSYGESTKNKINKLEEIHALLDGWNDAPEEQVFRNTWNIKNLIQIRIKLVLDGYTSLNKARPELDNLLRTCLYRLQEHCDLMGIDYPDNQSFTE